MNEVELRGNAGQGRGNRNYSKEFKAKCVAYVNEHPDIPYSKLAKRLGVTDSTLIRWVNVARAEEAESERPVSLIDERGEEEDEDEALEIMVVEDTTLVLPTMARNMAIKEHGRVKRLIERAADLRDDIADSAAGEELAADMEDIVTGLRNYHREVGLMIEESSRA